ncbi:TetR/AcrR family transcriptional regulator [Parafrankia sp. FMc6]|uniref:TetR/AcrR family transcriptional regulator n=1 Tax=Parafrankia soli TaxID=2599596 RepID=UPI0034D412F7
MTEPTPATTPRVGRPRRFDADTERGMIMDAAMRLMALNGYAQTSVGEILADAGLSTRSFYRHFESKEALLLALLERDAAAVARSLERAVAAASDPVAAIEAWLERFLDVFYEPRRAARVALFSSPAVRGSYPLADVLQDMRRVFCQPLVGALRAGHEAGLLRSPTPEADANSLYALVSAAADRHEAHFQQRAAARAHVVRFAWPALGLPEGETPGGPRSRRADERGRARR